MSQMSDAEKSRWIFEHNVQMLAEADFVICVSDGVQTDDGTAWEVGYAWAQGKPSIGVRFDVRDGCREKFSKFTNLMIENCCVGFAYTLEELDAVLAKFVTERE
jgi:nucleoside 2-deoxyribosyltransferase